MINLQQFNNNILTKDVVNVAVLFRIFSKQLYVKVKKSDKNQTIVKLNMKSMYLQSTTMQPIFFHHLRCILLLES